MYLQDYKKQNDDVRQKQKAYNEASAEYWKEVDTNGEMTEKAIKLQKNLNKSSSELDKAKEGYDPLAHRVVKYCLLLQSEE